MNIVILVLAIAAAAVVTLSVTALVDLLRHDGARPRSLPRSHPADAFDPDAQRFGRYAA